MKKLILTGAEGFIGRNIKSALEKKFEVKALSRSDFEITSAKSWNELEEADVVIQLAALTSVQNSWTVPELYIHNNTTITLNALKYCREHNAKLIILSSYMYGNAIKRPVDEEQERIATNPYGLSKKIDEEMVEFYINHFDLDATVLRLFNVYGADQDNNFLIGQMIEQACIEKKITINDNRPKRDYIHIDDVKSAILKVLLPDERFKSSFFNICSGTSYSVEEIANKIISNLSYKVNVVNRNIYRKNEIMDSLGSYKKIKEKYGWEPSIDIDKGILDLVACKVKNNKEGR